MKIDLELTKFRLKMNQINIDVSLNYNLDQQMHLLESRIKNPISFAWIKTHLNLAMEEAAQWKGFTSEVDLLVRKELDGGKVRGHDYLKLWFRCFFVVEYELNYIMAETLSHEYLQNILSHSEKNELINMMRGRKHG